MALHDPEEDEKRKGLLGLLMSIPGLLDQGMRGVNLENIGKIPGLMDRGMRSLTPESGAQLVSDFSPKGDIEAIRSIPGLLGEGRQGEAMLAGLSAIPAVGLFGDAARAFRKNYSRPIRKLLEKGDFKGASKLAQEAAEARRAGRTASRPESLTRKDFDVSDRVDDALGLLSEGQQGLLGSDKEAQAIRESLTKLFGN